MVLSPAGGREWISRFSLVRVGRTVYGRPADDESARLYSTDRDAEWRADEQFTAD